jgi:hypothetical protein
MKIRVKRRTVEGDPSRLGAWHDCRMRWRQQNLIVAASRKAKGWLSWIDGFRPKSGPSRRGTDEPVAKVVQTGEPRP